MDWFDSWGLTLVVFLPVVGMALVLLTPRDDERSLKGIALLTTLATFGAAIGVLAKFDYDKTGVLQLEVNKTWIG